MVLTHTTNHTYSHPFPTVTLAFFLRYCSPQINPFAAHVLSTDTISSHVDADGRLHTTRIHLKKSRLPGAVFKLLPTSITGGGSNNKASYVLETSIVDIREGWMKTESRNLNFVGVLSVVEKQTYTTPTEANNNATTTNVETNVVFRSRLGEKLREKIGQSQQQQEPREGWFSRLGTKGIQRSIENMASTKTLDQLGKSREGMLVVLERLRNTGLVNIMELTRRAKEAQSGTV
ncbi:hypothetical protein MCOR27_004460 [Pyricularia oryzae]|uniref:PRELI/MSF1 domain-containing protein n=5 Tax=Pyricularia TaxID=48558 RepID=A0ABQ8NEZ3_PYRGI|nr:MSF1 domain-containing protein [Pyricularia oryzae 70-15]ELQ38226.1 MSF1 domain-containing protein [Pyricularia oryzae Y34]KAH8847613.1 hypothetical protein MCOR01_001027 [Pyricularia oryzae]KAI6295969.1 hypothetical protein MCOR33_007268 [Pyricularia grisea]EHA52396.1 MSF1 domain-containing protein [Pyricularia oryzae 70-15]KAH9430457.1 hypothetical protein MCOR02_010158 [Pyricularia oryzae]